MDEWKPLPRGGLGDAQRRPALTWRPPPPPPPPRVETAAAAPGLGPGGQCLGSDCQTDRAEGQMDSACVRRVTLRPRWILHIRVRWIGLRIRRLCLSARWIMSRVRRIMLRDRLMTRGLTRAQHLHRRRQRGARTRPRRARLKRRPRAERFHQQDLHVRLRGPRRQGAGAYTRPLPSST